MTRSLIVRPEAESDLSEAYAWYEDRLTGLGSDFLLCVDAVMHSILRNPEMYALVYKDVRRALVRRFPYGVFYVVGESQLTVLAVFHAKRNPKSWQART